jgi:hypothetical protein
VCPVHGLEQLSVSAISHPYSPIASCFVCVHGTRHAGLTGRRWCPGVAFLCCCHPLAGLLGAEGRRAGVCTPMCALTLGSVGILEALAHERTSVRECACDS